MFQSRAHPREIMTEVLKALQELNVSWKKIGHYNMKCRWIPGIAPHEGMVNNSMHSNHYFGDDSTIIESDSAARLLNVVKFEVQVNILCIFISDALSVLSVLIFHHHTLAIFLCDLLIFLSCL